MKPATQVIALGRPKREPGAPLNIPPGFASTFHAGGLRLYARDDGTPSWEALEEVVGTLEGGHAVAFSSGMAACAAIFALARWTTVLIPEHGYPAIGALAAELDHVPIERIDIREGADCVEACRAGALLWLENPTNPLLDTGDVAMIATGARASGATMVVDNTFATPFAQRPIALGAHLSVHSATKYIAGHSDATIGIAVAHDEPTAAHLRRHRELHGAIPGSMETYLALRGIRTLPLRYERAQQNARTLVARLREHSEVARVRYPGFGAMIAFELCGDRSEADALCASVRLIVHATSLGGVETTIERRGKYHAESYLPENFIRLSVGCEDAEDLWGDLEHALKAAASTGFPTPVE